MYHLLLLGDLGKQERRTFAKAPLVAATCAHPIHSQRPTAVLKPPTSLLDKWYIVALHIATALDE